jgi:hypothetical protein
MGGKPLKRHLYQVLISQELLDAFRFYQYTDMARSLFSRLGTACLLYLYVINVIYLVPNKAVKKNLNKCTYQHRGLNYCQ